MRDRLLNIFQTRDFLSSIEVSLGKGCPGSATVTNGTGSSWERVCDRGENDIGKVTFVTQTSTRRERGSPLSIPSIPPQPTTLPNKKP